MCNAVICVYLQSFCVIYQPVGKAQLDCPHSQRTVSPWSRVYASSRRRPPLMTLSPFRLNSLQIGCRILRGLFYISHICVF